VTGSPNSVPVTEKLSFTEHENSTLVIRCLHELAHLEMSPKP
jgi:hypothetical protein